MTSWRKRTDHDIESGWWLFWKHGPRAVLTTLLMIAAFSFGGLFIYKYYAPAKADIERDVFDNTKSYVHGTIRDLDNLRMEYLKAESDAHKQALRSTILHRAATVDDADLPERLRSFVQNLRQESAS